MTDSTLALSSKIAQACRESKKVNGQYVLSTALRNAIQQDVAKRLLGRMKAEPSAEPGGLPPRAPFRLVGMADPENLTYSRMQSSASAGTAMRLEEPDGTALPSVSTGGGDVAMAAPVDTTGQDADCSVEEYKETVSGMMSASAEAADPPALGEVVPDFGGTSSAHSSPLDATMAAIDVNLKAISICSPALGSASSGLAEPIEELRLPQATLPTGARLGRCQRARRGRSCEPRGGPRLHAKYATQRSRQQGFGVIWACCFQGFGVIWAWNVRL